MYSPRDESLSKLRKVIANRENCLLELSYSVDNSVILLMAKKEDDKEALKRDTARAILDLSLSPTSDDTEWF